MAEFWYNSSYHTSLGNTPFKALYGVDPNFGMMPIEAGNLPTSLSELAADREDFMATLRDNLLRAQQRIKLQADKHRKDREFAVGEEVLLKLQPYAQSSLVNRPCRKLALKYFGPFRLTAHVGAVAYRLELPASSLIHPVFHISQLKPFTANYTPVFQELPVPPDLSAVTLQPEAILDRRMVKKGNTTIPQIKVQWHGVTADHATWEDYYVLRACFSSATLWDEAPAQGGRSVTAPSDPTSSDDRQVDPGSTGQTSTVHG